MEKLIPLINEIHVQKFFKQYYLIKLLIIYIFN
jgi:hypothetical protein